MKKYKELELLSEDDYKVLIVALKYANEEPHILEIEDWYYQDLLSKLERNLDKFEYNFSLDLYNEQ